MHIYVDESKSKAYIFAAVIIEPGKVSTFRKSMRNFLMPRQGHIHFVNESHARRKKILTHLSDFGVRARIYRTTGLNPIIARGVCMSALMDDLVELSATKLVFELEESALKSDENLLRQGLLKRGIKKQVEFCHVLKSEEPIVWAADAIAWSFARGDDFRKRALKVIEKVIDIAL